MKIQRFVVGENLENTYLIVDDVKNEAILVDPGSDGEKISDYIIKNGFNLKFIILTHAHYDHIGACDHIKSNFKVPIFAGLGEEVILENCENNLSIHLDKKIELKADRLLNDGERVTFGNLEFEVISTPGHTCGSICLYFSKQSALFSGDTLFYATVGRTDFPTGDTDSLLNSLEKIKKLPIDTKIFPGHGKNTTLEQEKFHNPYLSDREVL